MRTLHVAALAYPTAQGTQGLLHAMLAALGDAGHDTHLLCYGRAAFEQRGPYQVHRVRARRPLRSLRSGPSLEKLGHDLALARELARQVERLQPDAVIAHHVEAAGCALLCGVAPWLFVAHTALRTELPSYFPRQLARACAAAGGKLDALLCRRAGRVIAVSPLLAQLLSAESGCMVESVTLPWSVPAPTDRAESEAARRSLGLAPDAHVALYAGNLDAYQGLEPLIAGVSVYAAGDPRFVWLVATGSDPRGLVRRMGTARARLVGLGDESTRRMLYAAADVALVPRGSAGGLPIKLLDALARGVPVIAARRAAARLALDAVCRLIEGDAAGAWSDSLAEVFAHGRPGARAPHASAYVARDHAPARFVSELVAHVHALRAAAPRPI